MELNLPRHVPYAFILAESHNLVLMTRPLVPIALDVAHDDRMFALTVPTFPTTACSTARGESR